MTSRPVRVLHLRDSPWVDGPGRTILETASRIDRNRVDYQVGVFVEAAGKPHPLVQALRARNLPVHEIPDSGAIRRALLDRVDGLLRTLQIDVMHTSEFRSNVLALLCRRRRRVKLMSTAHGWIANDLRGRVYRMADRALLSAFDRVVVVSHAMCRQLPRWWADGSKVQVLHNALMLESYGRDVLDVPRQVPDPNGEVRLLSVGRLSPEKGQKLLLQAVAALRDEYRGLQIAFAGVGRMEQDLKDWARRLDLSDRVRFLGYVDDMPAQYVQSDLVVQSSFSEGLPNVILEAAYLRVPIIATDVGGTAEVLDHAVTGWLVKPRSVAELREGIRRYLEAPASFIEMARIAHQDVKAKFSIDVRTEKQTRLYEEVFEQCA